MKNIEIFDLASILSSYASQLRSLKGAKFGFALLKNIDKLSAEIKTLEAARNIPEAYKEYEQKRIALCEKYAEKDEKGQPKKIQRGPNSFDYAITPDNSDFIQETDKLREEYATALEEFKGTEAEYKTLLSAENAEFKLSMVNFEDVPSDISVELMSVVKPFIKDED